jgi:hypothetical protein
LWAIRHCIAGEGDVRGEGGGLLLEALAVLQLWDGEERPAGEGVADGNFSKYTLCFLFLYLSSF